MDYVLGLLTLYFIGSILILIDFFRSEFYKDKMENWVLDCYTNTGEYPPDWLLPVFMVCFTIFLFICWGPILTYKCIKGEEDE